MKNQDRSTTPPKPLTWPRLRMGNFFLVSGNLLAEIADWQAFTDQQPEGTAVMVMPSPASPLRGAYRAIARVLQTHGRIIKLYSAETK